jgi:hypothetical protein
MSGYTDSVAAELSLTLQGVWVHDPLDPVGTVQQYLYGKAARSTEVDVAAAGLVYAGRTYPVFEYGEHQSDRYNITVDVPNDEDWADTLATLVDFAESRRTLCVRDNRRRRMFGALSGYRESDEPWGTTASMTFARGDYDESVA